MALIEDYIKIDEIIWNPIFHMIWIDKAYEHDPEIKDLIDFLCDKVSFWYYKDIFEENPFKPFADFTISGGSRSADLNDLGEEDLTKIERVIERTKNNLILGFLNDILGLVRKNRENKLLAAKHFIEYAKEILYTRKYSNLILNPIKRAFALLSQLKNAKEIEKCVETFLNFSNLEDNAYELMFKVNLIEVFSYNQKIYGQILPYAENLFEKCKSNKDNISYAIILSKITLKIYKSKGDKNNVCKWAVIYAENLCNCDLPIVEIDKEIDNAIEELNKLNNFEWLNKLRLKKKQLNDKFYNNFEMQTIPYMPPKKIMDSMDDVKNNLIETFKTQDGLSQFCYFLSQFIAYPKKDIEKQLRQKEQYDFIDFVNNIRFDENKEIIFQSANASEKQKIENDTYEIYALEGAIRFDLLINPFLFYVKFDENLNALINDIVNHNLLVYKNHNVIINNIINGISKKQLRSALAGLLPQFEEGMRNYIERKGIIPIIRSGGNEVKTSLGQMMNNDGFRNLIDELLGDDLAQHIDYLACKELGGNLRNKYAHEGYGDDNQVSVDEAILFFLLIKAYCMGYD